MLKIEPCYAFAVFAVAFAIWVLFSLSEIESYQPWPRPTIGTQQEQAQAPASTNQGDKEPRGTPEFPLVVGTREGAPSKEIAAQQAEDRDQQATNERLLIATNVLLILVTLGVVIYTNKLWRATDALVSGADRTAKHQLRAYVSATVHRIEDLSIGSEFKVLIRLYNHGHTPAKEMHWAYSCAVLPYPLPKDTPLPTWQDAGKSRTIIQPNSDLAGFLFSEQPETHEMYRILTKPDWRLYILIQVEFVDIFGDHQWSRACVSLVREGTNLGRMILGEEVLLNWEHAPHYNQCS